MKKPARLRPGDRVAIVSLSSGSLGEPQFLHKYYLAKERLEGYGLQVVAMPNALKGREYLYRHPEARAEDLMDAFRDPEIKAVICAIGGDDTIRLLPYVDLQVLGEHPKIFTGFSDTTTNHFMLYKAGVVSYYGLAAMCNLAEYGGINEYTRRAMEKTLFDPQPTLDIPCSDFCSYDGDKVWWKEENQNIPTPRFPNTGYQVLQGSGKVTGRLLGGCVDVFLELLGTSLWPSLDQWEGKLLLLETSECNMDPDTLRWILRNLNAQGLFRVLRGIVVGKPAFREAERAYPEVFRSVVGFEAGRPDLPILYNVNVGHAYPIGLLPLGLEYELDCGRPGLRLLEPATA